MNKWTEYTIDFISNETTLFLKVRFERKTGNKLSTIAFGFDSLQIITNETTYTTFQTSDLGSTTSFTTDSITISNPTQTSESIITLTSKSTILSTTETSSLFTTYSSSNNSFV